jgi:hypothetical protein
MRTHTRIEQTKERIIFQHAPKIIIFRFGKKLKRQIQTIHFKIKREQLHTIFSPVWVEFELFKKRLIFLINDSLRLLSVGSTII